MRTSTSKAALLALAATAFALPAFAQDNSSTDPVRPPKSQMSPTNPSPAPSAAMKSDQATPPAAQTDMKAPAPSANSDSDMKNNSVAAAPDTGGAVIVGHHRASQIIGTAVVNDKDQTIGKIDDIIIGSDDKATMAVISVGGFLGIGAKLVAVPFNQLQPVANDAKSLTLPNASKEQLKSMPAFDYRHGA